MEEFQQGGTPAIAPVPAPAPVDLLLLPGFRFHPTDNELVYYLRRKVLPLLDDIHAFIPEVDLYKSEPWELPHKSFSPGGMDDPGAKLEWYLFAPRGRKYANGFRMNRATRDGFWKSTGKDRPIMNHQVTMGMKKTLVYHLGRAPNGMHTDWVMHEYRLHHHHIQDTYTLCRIVKKNPLTPPPEMRTDKDGLHTMLGGAGTDNEKSWMEFICNDDYWKQFIGDDAWYSDAA
ncbi:NAC domain containing protein 52-like [Triticum dicoccoides]|uniref:NAC domain containing protein 52-like n=1 Tax=Triticum dicoccoides TaxID=85692 RepID=UPI00188FA479|nr:NAC domain containing protein 52-like [Triticum dicoccoides]XP_037472414.1 NAC domain containing protein 52-like [Triticum dicoccoides]